MKKAFYFLTSIFILCMASHSLYAQQSTFLHPVNVKDLYGSITGISQDNLGYIWFSCNTRIGSGGLHRYDGKEITSYMHNADDTNSLSNNSISTLFIDSSGIIWIGTSGSGLDRFDPVTEVFTHFRHQQKNTNGISDNYVNAILEDHKGNLWIGTSAGLDLLDRATGKFTHYYHQKNNPSSLSNNVIQVLYEDLSGNFWVGTSEGLNLLNRHSGKFTSYFISTNTQQSIAYNSISAIAEDRVDNLWVGTYEAGLNMLDRQTKAFTHYQIDAAHPEKLIAAPLLKQSLNPVSFIQQDDAGCIWIGTNAWAVKKYNPETKTITYYERNVKNGELRAIEKISDDSLITQATRAFSSKNGLLWISTSSGSLYYTNPLKKNIPYFPIKEQSANSFYKDDRGTLWIATDNGLIRRDADSSERIFLHDKNNPNSISNSGINIIRPAEDGELWLGTNGGGLDKFNTLTQECKHYRHDDTIANSLGNDLITYLLIDQNKNLWVANMNGIDKLNAASGLFTHYRNSNDSNSLSSNVVLTMLEEKGNLWAGTIHGLNVMRGNTGKWKHYLQASPVKSVYVDAEGIIWAGTSDGLYYYDAYKDRFYNYMDSATGTKINAVLNITEDNEKRLWVTTSNAIYRINKNRNSLLKYGSGEGMHANEFLAVFGFTSKDGELFLGDQGGYYAFYPDRLTGNENPPIIQFTSFELKNKKVKPGNGSPLKLPLSVTKKIILGHNQNSFSFNFIAIDFANPDSLRYQYMMKNYDNTWHDLGSLQRVDFFSMPPGSYVFRVKAINNNDTWSEKDMEVVVRPPWWTTWWAITIFILLLIAAVWAFANYRSRKLRHDNLILEKKINHRTDQLNQSLVDLKATQKKLIQSEKLASLGELTAGIAHEIQNPLNFVNNFSEVSNELVDEMKTELVNGNQQEAFDIADDLKQNLGKILHHGKRAQAIVTGMLEHSKASSGKIEPTDINALTNEYFRLSFHGMRAKDKSFNAEMKTDFDNTIGKINVIPQDIGRVLLNLFNNAFYATSQKQKAKGLTQKENYEPMVFISTKKNNDKVEIKVTDNGNGIPQKIVDKIFQPFFTTKPTGEGTGLGLSLAYDIVKAHGGELKVESKESEGSEFIIQLPMK